MLKRLAGVWLCFVLASCAARPSAERVAARTSEQTGDHAVVAIPDTNGAGDYGAESYRLISQPDEIVAVLQNGLVVVTKRIPSPVTSVRGYVFAGGVYEGKWLGGGLSHLLEHLVAGGTNERRSEEQNRNLLQEIGNNSNAYTYADRTAFFVNTTNENAAKAIDLVTGWMLGAKITPAEYAREYEVVQRELEKDKGEADWVYYDLSNFNRYRVSPARVPVIGYKEVIQGLSRDDVYAYYKLAYVPNNMMFVVAGDRDPEELLAEVRRNVKEVPPGRAFEHGIAGEPPPQAPRTLVATFPKLGQARVGLAFPSVKLDHPDLYALDLLATVLGGGDSSIMNEEIRDKRQLATEILVSDATPPYVEGSFSVDLKCDPGKIKETTRAVLDVLEKVKTDGVDAERISRAKALMRTSAVYGRQTAETIAESLADGYISAGDVHFLDHYTDRIQHVDAKQLQAVAKKYLNLERLITTVMLPEEYVGASGLPKAQEIIASATAKKPASTRGTAPVERVVLDNGTVLLVKRMATSPIVSVNLFALGGVTAEDERANGLGNLAMEMLTRGTTTKSAQQIAETLDALGAQVETGAGNNSWFWKATSLREDFPKLMEAYADVVNNPAFPEPEISGMKERVLAAIEGQDADWFAQAMRFFRKSYFGPERSPYQFTVLGTAETVKSFDRAAISKWYYQTILSRPRVLAIYGDVEVAQAKQLASKYFDAGTKPAPGRKGKPADTTSNAVAATPSPTVNVTRVEVNKTNNPQAGVVIGFKSDAVVGTSDQPAIDLADCMTSGYGYPTGYIFEILRGRGLVYDANAMNFPGVRATTPGAFIAYAGCDPKNVNECIDVILESVARLQGTEADVKADWFARSKSLITTGDAVQNETPAARAQQAALDELYGLGYDYHDQFAARVNAATIDAVRRYASAHLRECVVTISTPAPDKVTVKPGTRTYANFPPVDLTPRGVQHDAGGAQK